jgi:predicted nucleotide-binding protein (sugar kinase/HSP70/actin superfamily)
MIISFPHMGGLSIVLKAVLTGLGCEVLLPPPISKRTLELGVKYSPETVCLPFKITLGNFIEALNLGADTIVTCGGVGPCRLGYYAEVQKGILRGLGYEFEMIIFEPNISDVFKNVSRIAPKHSLWEIFSALYLALEKMKALDSIQRKVLKIHPLETNIGEADALWKKAIDEINTVETVSALRTAWHRAEHKLGEIKLNNGVTPIRIGVVGEFYVMMEPFANLDLDRRLGAMGVEVDKTTQLSDYVNGHLFRKSEYLEKFKRLASLAQPYLGHYVGGHGLKSIAHTVNMGRENYDGIIHVFPFTCMPEVIAKNILPKVSNDVDIPVLSIAYDEQSGEAGVLTRLEAFIDLLKYRRLRNGNSRPS